MRFVQALVIVLMLIAVAMHAPGQWSFDSVVALGEASEGRAVGWGSPFFAAFLAWLGGGEGAAALFVALMAASWGAVLLGLTQVDRTLRAVDAWRVVLMLLIIGNPMLWLYVGIVWKDVLLGTFAVLAIHLFDQGLREVGVRWRWWLPAVLVLATLPLIRQQGIILAVVIALIFGARVSYEASHSWKALSAGALLLGVMGVAIVWSSLANRTITPPERSPFGVGFLTVISYDVLGTIAHMDAHPEWADVDRTVAERIRRDYSAERIDLAWRDPAVSHWIQQRSAESLRTLWWSAIREEPSAYAMHRLQAAKSLLGFSSMIGCVPGYWGVAGPPDVLAKLGVPEAMDPRDRWLGRWVLELSETPLLRHWFYLGLCALALIALLRRRRWTDAPAWAAAISAMTYAASYLPTTIACDFRYLYPSAALSLFACLWLVMDGMGRGARSKEIAF